MTTYSPTPSHSLQWVPASSLGAHPAQHPRQASRQVDTHMGRGHRRGEIPFVSSRLAVAGGSPEASGGAGLGDTPLPPRVWAPPRPLLQPLAATRGHPAHCLLSHRGLAARA